MKQLTLKEHHRILVDILVVIDRFCRENHLRYSIAYGTLIGAIRHKGFIPWDDDIDIVMPRPDYDYFVTHFNGYNGHLNCFNDIAKGKDRFIRSFHKVQDVRTLMTENGMPEMLYGINIDVFPIDGLPETKEDYHSISLKENRWEKMVIMSYGRWSSSKSIKDILMFILAKLMGTTFWYRKMMSVLTSYNYDTASYAGAMSFGEKERFPKHIFEEYIEVEFEGSSFMALKAYDYYLKQLYGDYMTLPPVEKQVSHHCTRAYLK